MMRNSILLSFPMVRFLAFPCSVTVRMHRDRHFFDSCAACSTQLFSGLSDRLINIRFGGLQSKAFFQDSYFQVVYFSCELTKNCIALQTKNYYRSIIFGFQKQTSTGIRFNSISINPSRFHH